MASSLLDMKPLVKFGHNRSFRRSRRAISCISQVGTKNTVVGEKQNQTSTIERNAVFTEDNYSIASATELPPLVRALKTSAEEKAATFHFPGHNRGHAAPSSLSRLIGSRPFVHDLPELPELDNLFAPEGPILEAQKQAAELFGALETWFLVGGSTCGVQATIMATCSPGDTIILPRNSHISAISGMVLSGALPKYIIPEYDSDWDVAGGITPLQVKRAIKELEIKGQKPAAVLVVSPTYHGICSNLSEIVLECHSHDIPVIVDEAHGAHLGFHPQLPRSALSEGADLVVQSTHKVLCSLTQSSMLHMGGNLLDRNRIHRCLQMLQSSSPSYLLLASLDAARAQLSANRESIFNKAIELAMGAKDEISRTPGISVLDFSRFPNTPFRDPLRITVGVWQLGLSGFEADDILSDGFGVVSELVGTKSITLAFNLGTQRDHVGRLVSALKHLSATSYPPKLTANTVNNEVQFAPFDDIHISMSPRQAFFAPKRRVSIKESLGRICGELVCPYPPGIPMLIPGEIITKSAVNYLMQIRGNGGVISGVADHSLSSLIICE